MKAEAALLEMKNNLIVADVARGSLFIHNSGGGPGGAWTESVRLRFVQERNAEVEMVGLYHDLDVAVTIANIGYGVSEEAWFTADPGLLHSTLASDEWRKFPF